MDSINIVPNGWERSLFNCYAITIDLLQSYFRTITWSVCLKFSFKTLLDIVKHLTALTLMSLFLGH